MKSEHIREIIEERNPNAELLEGFDDALVGTCLTGSKMNIVACYDSTKVINIIQKSENKNALDSYNDFMFKRESLQSENSPVFLSDFRPTKDINAVNGLSLEDLKQPISDNLASLD